MNHIIWPLLKIGATEETLHLHGNVEVANDALKRVYSGSTKFFAE